MKISLLFWLLLVAYPAGLEEMPAGLRQRIFRVAVPVADLRREPIPAGPTLGQDPLEESQLLYGDPVEIVEEKGGWVRVAALEQMEFDHHQRWEGYPGWIERRSLLPDPQDWDSNLVVTAKWASIHAQPERGSKELLTVSLGTRLTGITKASPKETHVPSWWKLRLLDGGTGWIQASEVMTLNDLKILKEEPSVIRTFLVQTALLFLGDPYYWGGRSAHRRRDSGPPHTAVDCSGLVGLIYQANGLSLPRDAHEQWMKAKAIPQAQLLPGDLIFLSDPQDLKKVSHVMLYAGEGQVIEGPGTGKVVRKIGLEERLKESQGRKVFFGTYLSSPSEAR